MKKIVSSTILISLTFILFSGCSSRNVTIAPILPEKYEVLGKAEGKASGSLGIIATAYNFIPMGLNSRVQRAYDNAVNSVPGATGIINITYQENWFWWLIGTSRDVTIKGDAIKEIKE
ncbi:MAG: hypothetical protein ACI9RG_000591 [Sulfurimonas sp.]|jgi:hypothetical protein